MRIVDDPAVRACLIGIMLGIAAIWAFSCQREPQHLSIESLERRAQKIFVYDRENHGHLAAHEIRALSLALAFHDHVGAGRVLDRLEEALKKAP